MSDGSRDRGYYTIKIENNNTRRKRVGLASATPVPPKRVIETWDTRLTCADDAYRRCVRI